MKNNIIQNYINEIQSISLSYNTYIKQMSDDVCILYLDKKNSYRIADIIFNESCINIFTIRSLDIGYSDFDINIIDNKLSKDDFNNYIDFIKLCKKSIYFFDNETDLGECLLKYFNTTYPEYLLFPEVTIDNNTSCDLLYKNKNDINCIECKLKFTLKLLEQTVRWKDKADYIWICIPHKEYNYAYMKIIKYLGIGIYLVDERGRVSIENTPDKNKILDKYKNYWDCILNNELTNINTNIPGSNKISRITNFKRTVNNILEYYNKNPKTTLEECLKNIQHHYSSYNSAKQSILKYIDSGIIKLPNRK